MLTFSTLGLIEPLQRALRDQAYAHPTPIQVEAIPRLIEGRDLLACARTGTGKTAAFALPILQRLASAGRRPQPRAMRALVLVPTRELATQVAGSFSTYGRHLRVSVATVHGGVGQGPQVKTMLRGVDVLVATTGRLLDLVGQGHVRLDGLEVLVLDEADHMLDLGFIPDVRRILARVPATRQTLLFSATMPEAIASLADGILTRPVKVHVTPAASTVDEVDQRVHFVARAAKPTVLARELSHEGVTRAIVFTRTKRGADRVARQLIQDGVTAAAIHGNKSQGARERTLRAFRGGGTRVLVATDIAARGIDVDGITHVINYEIPDVPESYVHRIGRTARAGATGVAISLCDAEERGSFRDIERLIRRQVRVVGGADASSCGAGPGLRPGPRSGSGHAEPRRQGGAAPARPPASASAPSHREWPRHAAQRPRATAAVPCGVRPPASSPGTRAGDHGRPRHPAPAGSSASRS
jgi:ATP-dependent RNA helicase RhlE